MTKTYTQAALTAKAIRKELKQRFPKTKFSVRSENYSMGNSVRATWTNGPTERQVEEVIKKYQYGHFDGMTDMYEQSNSRDDIPQAKYVFADRTVSDDVQLATARIAQSHYGELEKEVPPVTAEDLGRGFKAFDQYYNWAGIVYPILKNIDLTDATGIEIDPDWTGGSLWSGFRAIKGGESK